MGGRGCLLQPLQHRDPRRGLRREKGRSPGPARLPRRPLPPLGPPARGDGGRGGHASSLRARLARPWVPSPGLFGQGPAILLIRRAPSSHRRPWKLPRAEGGSSSRASALATPAWGPLDLRTPQASGPLRSQDLPGLRPRRDGPGRRCTQGP